MGKLNWFNKVLFTLNCILCIFTGVSLMSIGLQPSAGAFFYLLALAFPFLLGLNVVFVIYWVYLKKFHFVFSLLFILFSYQGLNRSVGFNLRSPMYKDSTFSIMSFNVRLFNRFEWLPQSGIDTAIFSHISAKNPDILAIQEFTNVNQPHLQYIEKLKSLGYTYYQLEPQKPKSSHKHYFGLALFSKYKIKNAQVASIMDNNKAASVYYDVVLDTFTVRIFNTHLQSLRFGGEDYQFVENIGENTEKEAIKKSKNLLSKVVESAKKRQLQVASLEKQILESPFPVIVCGDFNEPPNAYAYPVLQKHLLDPFQKFAFGFSTTYDGISTLPGVRLDYVLHTSQLISTSYAVGPKGLSDHRSVFCAFKYSK